MGDGHDKILWEHTSAILATLANLHRDPKKKPYSQADFNPLLAVKKEPLPGNIEMLKIFLPPNSEGAT